MNLKFWKRRPIADDANPHKRDMAAHAMAATTTMAIRYSAQVTPGIASTTMAARTSAM